MYYFLEKFPVGKTCINFMLTNPIYKIKKIMKKVLLFALVLAGFFSHGQELSFENPILKKGCAMYELVSVDDWGVSTVDYTLYDGDLVLETGRFVDMKRSGLWKSYDKDGKVLIEVMYAAGKKKWLKDYRHNRPIHIVYEEGKPVKVTYYLASN